LQTLIRKIGGFVFLGKSVKVGKVSNARKDGDVGKAFSHVVPAVRISVAAAANYDL